MDLSDLFRTFNYKATNYKHLLSHILSKFWYSSTINLNLIE
jgi:hypothetical protein